ncbi:hypothetical protein QBC34DRAFT_114914 [Podospora aff. communis PSN243]|uniref:Secreted protein n=1 Tax=Podospora aff. communis PSN243 TaxID=3040156 RepID=A0AAV9GHF4_9PEZI|nr:hypothetical protein QBC34DRAFT_114914 [Podospora aff. communis PSN243]
MLPLICTWFWLSSRALELGMRPDLGWSTRTAPRLTTRVFRITSNRHLRRLSIISMSSQLPGQRIGEARGGSGSVPVQNGRRHHQTEWEWIDQHSTPNQPPT